MANFFGTGSEETTFSAEQFNLGLQKIAGKPFSSNEEKAKL